MEELNNVQAAAADSEQEEKKTLSEGEFYYDRQKKEVTYGEKSLGMGWFLWYRWGWLGFGAVVMAIGFVISVICLISTGDPAYYIMIAISAILASLRIYLFIMLPKFSSRAYKINYVSLFLMPVTSLISMNAMGFFADIIAVLLNVVYFQKRSFMFGIKKEECRGKYKLKRLAGPAAALILPVILSAAIGLVLDGQEEKAAIVNAEEDYKILAEAVGFDSAQEMEEWLEENCDVDFSDMETSEKLEYVVSTNMGFASYEDAEGNRNPFSEEIIYNKGDYQRYLMDCVMEDEEAYLYSDKKQIYYVTPDIAKKTTKGTIVAKFNELAEELGYEDYLELLQSFDNWKDYEGLSPRKQFERLAEEYVGASYEELLGYRSPYDNDLLDSFADYQDYVITSLTEE